jgi:3-phosphoshikimate 1-carboxyvinyltransferase
MSEILGLVEALVELGGDAVQWLYSSSSPGLNGRIAVPGDKSMSHRALIFGGLADGETEIVGLLEGQDVLHTAAAVAALGAHVERLGDENWLVKGAPWRSPEAVIDCGNSGTGVRLLMGAVGARPIAATFTGDQSLRGRPMNRVLDPLRQMGVEAEASEGGRLPATIRGGALTGISFRNEKASAQVKSAILLAGLGAKGEVEVIEPAPSRDHTENMLRAFGADVEVHEESGGRRIRLGQRRQLTGARVEIPGDPSSAAFPIVAALIVPDSEVTITDVMMNPLRTGLLTTLVEMGADLSFANRRTIGGEEVADVTARSSRLRAVAVPAVRAPSMIDEYPILAIAAAFAEGRSVMEGIAELRVKESDRLAAIIAGLRACGVEARDEGDSLIVEGRGTAPRGGGQVTTHGDHRIAMSFLVMGLASEEKVSVDEAGMIGTSFPGFADLMRSIGAKMESVE